MIDAATELGGPAVARQPTIAWRRAHGVHVEDVDGNVFLDFTSSVLVANVGHAHPRIVAAIREQAEELIHSYNFVNPWRLELEQRLVELGRPYDLERVFIGTTGAEVVEMALKLARWNTGRQGTLALEGGYHGKTLATTAIGGRPEATAGLGAILPGVVLLPFPAVDDPQAEAATLAELARLERSGEAQEIGTVIAEVFQGNAGQRATRPEFLLALQDWARRQGAVFILDETQTAAGRTGAMFAFEHLGLRPDLVVAGKGISSSLPITVMLGRAEIFDVAPPRGLSSTHGGNPMSCRAACEALSIIEDERLLENAQEVGAHLAGALREAVARSGLEAEVRGIGLMIGIEVLDGAGLPDAARARAIVDGAIARGLLLITPIGLGKNVIRISPPLVLTEQQATEGAALIAEAMADAA